MTDKKAFCCEKCLEELYFKDARLSSFWIDLCEIHDDSENFGLLINDPEEFEDIQDREDIRTLEIEGFILTSETPEMIIIKVLGRTETKEEVSYCGGKCEYANSKNL